MADSKFTEWSLVPELLPREFNLYPNSLCFSYTYTLSVEWILHGLVEDDEEEDSGVDIQIWVGSIEFNVWRNVFIFYFHS